MHTKTPGNSKFYVFGSFLRAECPADLDILVIYDPEIVHPASAHAVYKPLFNELGRHTGLKVDYTLLTYSEAEQSNFVSLVGAVECSECSKLCALTEQIL